MKRGRFFAVRFALCLACCLAGLVLAMVALASAAKTNTSSPKIAPQVLANISGASKASIVILLAKQANVRAGYAMKDHDARGWYVYHTLTQHAARTQVSLRTFLEAQGISYQPFWAANMIVASADSAQIEAIAARDDVARIDSNAPTRWMEETEVARFGITSERVDAVTAIEWGVSNVNAPAVWALGFAGNGIVVGSVDTGVRWTHSALKLKYRGWNGVSANHNFNWHDTAHIDGGACGPDSVEPCDDDVGNGHGTHTAGTMVGDDGGANQIGVAPGAKWIACRTMDQGSGTPASYTECLQFMIAPTDLNGNNPNPALRPHILNNSWECPASEGCTTRAELEIIVNNTQAAGIFFTSGAGNSGPACSTVSDPPAIYSDSFAVGAYDMNNLLAGFSSRGPSTFYNPNLLKPNLSAPGAVVRSSKRTNDTSFGILSGTSMAAPHVTGVVALLWSARPDLVRNIVATKELLQGSANPAVTVSPAQTCGGTTSTQIPNNSFGYGRLDALAALFAGSPLRITSTIRLTNGHIVLQAVGLAGAVHTVQTSPDLSPNSFQALPNSPTADATGVLQYDDADAVGSTRQFYRLRFP